MSKEIKALYKCLRCDFEYWDKPGYTSCPKCGHNMIKWVNYNPKDFKDRE